MEVGEEGTIRAIDDVGDASGFQVAPQHLCGQGLPALAPEEFARRLVGKVGAQQFGDIEGQGLHFQLAALVLPGGKGHRWRVALQVETLGGETGQGRGAKAAAARGCIEVEAITTVEVAKGVGAAAGHIQQAPQFLGFQVAPIVSPVNLDIARF